MDNTTPVIDTKKNAAKFYKVVETYIKRDGINDLMDWLGSTDFFEAPASTRFHGSYEGGLCQHSLNVGKWLNKLAEGLYPGQYTKETLTLVALFHDVCKANCYKTSTRNVKNEQTGQWEKVPFFACITNTVVAFAAEQDIPQTKITIKVAEPVKLVIKVANQDGNEETYDIVPTDDSSCVQEIVSDNVVLQTNFEEGEEQEKEDTATVSSQENDTSEPVSDEIQEIDDVQEFSEITDSQDAVSIYEDTSQYKKYMNLSDTQKEYFSDAAEEFGVSEAMTIGICYNESRFTPTATNVNTNGTTDWGIAQCNDTTFSYLNSVLGISSMYDVLDMQTGIRACCALLAHYKSMGLSENDILLAYQEGLGNYQDVKQGKEEPWKAYYNVLKNIEIYSTLVKT